MRSIGEFSSEENANTLQRILLAQGIESLVRVGAGDRAKVWVLDEKELDKAVELAMQFKQDPNAEQFQNIEIDAKSHAKLQKQDPLNNDPKAYWKQQRRKRMLTLNYGYYKKLMILIGIVFLLQSLPQTNQFLVRWFFIAYYDVPFHDILNGQIWRLVTPILMHGGFLHVGFNLMWLYHLGRMIEEIEGTFKFTVLVLGIAALSNVLQYVVSGPMFYGLSGVVYGFLGYIFMMSRFQNSTRYHLDQFTVIFMFGWLILCMIPGVFDNIANGVHVGGVICGLIWGGISANRANRKGIS